jgi:hypothetical protein
MAHSNLVLICGTRFIVPGHAELLRALFAHLPSTDVVMHGGATGVDTTAGREAQLAGLRVKVVQAQWKEHGRGAGPIRNEAMVAAGPRVVYALPHPSEPSAGTRDTMARAKLRGIPVFCAVLGADGVYQWEAIAPVARASGSGRVYAKSSAMSC